MYIPQPIWPSRFKVENKVKKDRLHTKDWLPANLYFYLTGVRLVLSRQTLDPQVDQQSRRIAEQCNISCL